MSPSDKQPGLPTIDLQKFWRNHDQALDQHMILGNSTLSHDLYRGMPSWFNAYYAYFQRWAIQRLIGQCKLPPHIRTLDVGCGTGRWSELMLSRGWKPFGMDIGKQTLLYAAKASPEIHFIRNMLPFLCFAAASFDLAISVTVLQHIPYKQQKESLEAIYRVIKPGGYLLICETIDTSDPSPHIFANSLKNWSNQFSKTGFRIVKIVGSEYVPHVQFYHWLRGKLKTSLVSIGHSDVQKIAQNLTKNPILIVVVWLGILISYPLEFVASILFPTYWARLGCFLLQKE